MASAGTIRPIRIIRHARIPLSDGIVLSAQIWLPVDAEADPVPAILEYLPYRKRDGTADRDALNHPYVAARGYACVRVDMRGAGDSEGVLLGEYLRQEQDDALEVMNWIERQPWSSGRVGMIGISWGGFNGLQIAARRPKQLKAVISICSTDDRYADDIHFMGGCVLVDKFAWGSSMFAIAPTPPDPALVGDQWRALWRGRLEQGGLYVEEWHRHQRRDDFYRHGSICEDYGAITAATYLVGGWMDGYSNAVFRMLEHLRCPRKGLVGPWAHKYPNFAMPGPQIGFLQETLRWWDHWLKDIDTGIMDEPMLRAWLQDTVPPRTHHDVRPGRWVADPAWPSPAVAPRRLGLAPGRLSGEAGGTAARLSVASPQTVGLAAGKWCPFGIEADEPDDQRLEAGGSLVFDSDPFGEPLDLLGAPVARFRISADRADALVAAVLSEVLPDGSATRLSYGLLNLTHRDGHVDLKPVEPGRFYDVAIKLNDCGQRIGRGSRLRLAVSSAYWPIVWPSPGATTLTLELAGSSLDLPVRTPRPADDDLRPFAPAVNGPALVKTEIRKPSSAFTVTRDIRTGEVVMLRVQDDGKHRIDDIDWQYGVTQTRTYAIHPADPLSARVESVFRKEFGRDGLDLAVAGHLRASVSATHFRFEAHLEAWENGERIFEHDRRFDVPRDHV
ncbi:MAG: CocE/NonD family hydrolase [Rhodobacteraceae bacterium]|nr:CocE/NonD family hydrolase [Paracoccaceae bacterium]